MAFPLITILTSIPSIITAYKTVKTLHDKPESANLPKGKRTVDLTRKELNEFKKDTATLLLTETLLPVIKKRGGNKDDLSTIIDMACFIYKMIRFKR